MQDLQWLPRIRRLTCAKSSHVQARQSTVASVKGNRHLRQASLPGSPQPANEGRKGTQNLLAYTCNSNLPAQRYARAIVKKLNGPTIEAMKPLGCLDRFYGAVCAIVAEEPRRAITRSTTVKAISKMAGAYQISGSRSTSLLEVSSPYRVKTSGARAS